MTKRNVLAWLAVSMVCACGGGVMSADGGDNLGGGSGGGNTGAGGGSAGTGGNGGGGGTQDAGAQMDPRLNGMLERHNVARANAMPTPNPALPPMRWAADLAAASQAYADKCIFEHDEDNPWGENLAANFPPGSQTAADVVANWESEKADYNYSSNSCSNVCGHYTQLVWRTSVEVGCGVKTCNAIAAASNSRGEIWVCRYRAAGNFVGKRPY